MSDDRMGYPHCWGTNAVCSDGWGIVTMGVKCHPCQPSPVTATDGLPAELRIDRFHVYRPPEQVSRCKRFNLGLSLTMHGQTPENYPYQPCCHGRRYSYYPTRCVVAGHGR